MLTLEGLLSLEGISPMSATDKLVRHADSRFVIENLRQEGVLEAYQAFQGSPVFDRCSHIISFIGEDGPKSRFLGIYKVGARLRGNQGPPEYRNAVWAKDAKHWYQLTRVEAFDEMTDRVVIDWGKGTRSWHQWFRDRPILEIRPKGRSLHPFRDYLQVYLTHRQLCNLVEHRDAHHDWFSALSAVGGVYLIVSKEGTQYVGSATVEKGLWQRCAEYARTGHANNRELRKLCMTGEDHPAGFTFSILETFSKYVSKEVALEKEAFFKHKLGSMARGLNAN